MKIGLTINLGDFNSLRVDTGEHDTLEACIKELIHILQKTPNPAVQRFYYNLYGHNLPKKKSIIQEAADNVVRMQKKSDVK